MTKAEMHAVLSSGRKLIQGEWVDINEIAAIDELVAEGKAHVTPWHLIGRVPFKRRVVTRVQP